jgi:thymidylate synthase
VSRKDSGSVFKECNTKRHYDARHKEKYDVFQGQVRTDKSESLQRALLDQQKKFKSRVNENLAIVRASFHVAKLIAQEGRPFTDEYDRRIVKKKDVLVMSVFLPVKSLGELMTLVTSHCHVQKTNVSLSRNFRWLLMEALITVTLLSYLYSSEESMQNLK